MASRVIREALPVLWEHDVQDPDGLVCQTDSVLPPSLHQHAGVFRLLLEGVHLPPGVGERLDQSPEVLLHPERRHRIESGRPLSWDDTRRHRDNHEHCNDRPQRTRVEGAGLDHQALERKTHQRCSEEPNGQSYH